MANTSFRQLILFTGIMVAVIVVILINTAFINMQPAQLDQPSGNLNELVHYGIPNIIFYF